MRVAVVGTGAVGTVLAGALAGAGYEVLACARRTPERDEVTVEDGDGVRTRPCRWLRTPDEAEPVDHVVLATKLHHDPSPWLARLVGEDTAIVAAQNGVDHRERLGERAVPALVYMNVDRVAVGHARLRRTDRDLVVPDDDAGRRTRELFAATGLRVETDADFTTAAWTKLLTNATANPLTALTGRRCEVVREPSMAELALRLLEETATVGRAEGARLPADAAATTLAWLQALPDGATTSMLQDRLAGRPLEHDGLTGAVVRAAARHGVAVPTSRTVLALLDALPTE